MRIKWPKKKKSNKGKGCICHAYYCGECACGADWSNNDGYNQAIDECKSAFNDWRKQNGN